MDRQPLPSGLLPPRKCSQHSWILLIKASSPNIMMAASNFIEVLKAISHVCFET